MSATSKTDPQLAKGEPIVNAGKASVSRKQRGEKYERTSSADTQVSGQGGGGGAAEATAEVHLSP